MRFARLVVAVLGFPLVWSLCLTFCDSFRLVSDASGGWLPPGVVPLLLGMVAFLLLLAAAPAPVRMYVLGHELTHALWGLAFGARVSRLRVGLRGGSVSLTKSNVLITLAPYFFPFWTALVVALALAVRAAMHFCCPGAPLPAPWAWMFAIGFTWSLHLLFTLRSLMQRQPDVEEYGRVFSWTLILALNLAVAILWMVCTTPVSPKAVGRRAASNAADAYAAVWRLSARMASFAYDTIRANGN